MAGRDIQLVCLDIGGVMIRLCDGFADACRRTGVSLPDGFQVETFREQWAPLVAEHEMGRMSQTAFCRASAQLVRMQQEHLSAISDAWLVEPYAGIGELLDELRGRGVATACLSNTNDSHWSIMHDAAGPYAVNMSKLDHRFASHLLGLRKPDAAIHRAVERQTGVAAGNIVFFDDSPDNVAGARTCGWRAFRIDPGCATNNPAAQIRRHLRDLGTL